MKKIGGIICEFNPLHEGHKYIISEAKKTSDALVCIMSGNFVQRGECACGDKYSRAKRALDAGADLVVSLPFPWCAAPAEFFARAGVTLARALGVTDLVFGSESGDVAAIFRAAALADDKEFSALADELSSGGEGFAFARHEAALRIAPEIAGVFASPNDMLASEYVRQSRNIGYEAEHHAVRRLPGYSAAAIRAESGFRHDLFNIERTLFCLGKHSSDSFDHESGIINRLEKCALASCDGDDMFQRAATRKYTDARLRRAALFSCLGITKSDLADEPDYTLLLAANGAGREILGAARGVEIVTKPADAESLRFELERRSDRLFALAAGIADAPDIFMKKSPYIC